MGCKRKKAGGIIAPYIAKIPDQDTELLGQTVSNLISEDTKILKNGCVEGTLKYVDNYSQFSNDTSEQSGHFFPVILGDQYKSKTIKVTGSKVKEVKEAKDTEWVLRVNDNQSTFKFECESEPIMTLSFKNAKLTPKSVSYSSKKAVSRKKSTSTEVK